MDPVLVGVARNVFEIAIAVGALIALIRLVANNYIKVPPNKVAIFYGRKRITQTGEAVGFRVITGGSKFKIPIVESVSYLELNMFSIELTVHGAPNKDGVLTNVKGVANVKFLSDEPSLMAASERFLGMSSQAIKDIAYRNLEGHLRAIIGRLTMEEIVSDRTKFNQEVLREASEDLKKMGLGIDVLTVQEVDDELGYIKALGQSRTAEVKRDAAIGTAEADRDATIRSSTAEREAQQTARNNDALVLEAEKDRDVKKALFDAEVERERATASQAGPLAAAQARAAVIAADTEIARAEAARTQQQLLSTIVRQAEAEQLAAVARADGERQAAILAAEAEEQKKILEGRGRAFAIRAEGEAQADVIRLKLLAEAEGVLKKAEAYEKLEETGQVLQILEQLQVIIPAALRELAPVMAEIAKPLAGVDRISLVDFGGNGATDGGSVARFAQVVPQVLIKLFEGLRAVGLNPDDLSRLLRVGENSEPHVSS